MIALRPYQEEALAAIDDARGHAQLVALPTGTGKTVVFSELIRRRGGTALVLAHRDELLSQAGEKIAMVAPELGMSLGYVQGPRDDTGAAIVVASVQTLARQVRLDRLPRHFDTVVVDEAHHATAETYRRVLKHVADSPLVVGFTATPERADNGRLGEIFNELVYARGMEEMIREGYLSNLRGIRVELEDLDLTRVKKSRGDYQADALGRALEDADAVEHSIAAYQEHAAGRRALAFLPTVALAKETAQAARDAGLRAGEVNGETPRDERRALLASLKAGDLDLVANVGVLTEGFDEPSLDCIIVAAPTRSRVRYVQMVGRGTRLHPGKDDCLILDVAGVTRDLSLQSVAQMFGLSGPLQDGETVTQARDREAAAAAAERARPERETQRYSYDVDLFNRQRINWTRIGDRWSIQLGEEIVVIEPHDEAYRVLLVRKTGAKILARNLDLGYAQGTAEQLIRDHGSVHLNDTEAPWRSHEATRGQLKKLSSLGVAAHAGMTKGEASDAITAAIARRRIEKLDRAVARQAA